MKGKLPVIDINGVKYLYDVEGKRLVFANNPTQSITLDSLKNDSRYLDFFVSAPGVHDIREQAVHFIIQKHALLGQKPTKEEQKLLNLLAKLSTLSNQEGSKLESPKLKRKFKW